MCGIAGIINFDSSPATPDELQRMTDAIAHRGPDGEGHYIDGPVGLGHRRLAIIDLSEAGKQPMITADGRYVISYNGEIYNFLDLKIELQALGYVFRSRTDSEVVVNAFAEWGVESLRKFNGMFAFGVWDRRQRRLTLARDRYGIKPVYWTRYGDTILFGSEIKAIFAHSSRRPEMCKEGLVEYFTFQNFFTNNTIFKDIQILEAGSYICFDLVRRSVSDSVRYWDFSFEEPENADDENAYLEELDRLFQQAVKRQLVSDVDIGSYLSGGMDSGSVTALAGRQLPYIKTFTCGFDLSSASGVEISFDERAAAERMSHRFRTEHYEMVLKAGDMERVLPRFAWHLEEPRVGQSYPNFYVAQLASKFVKVVLSGAGGDEIFGGYPWRYYRAVVNDNFEDYINKYYVYWQRLIPNRVIKDVFRPVWPEVEGIYTRDTFRDVFHQHADQLTRPEDYINHSLYLEAKTFLHGLLVVEDKLSMAHGLETRVPFLDNDLVDFAMRLPVHLKLGKLKEVVSLNENEVGLKTARYFQKTKDGKLLLRKMMGKYIPAEVVEREKQGFSAPDASWFKGESIDYVRRALYSSEARIFDYLDRDAVTALVEEHLSGEQNRRLLIWSLLNVEELCKRYL